MKSMQQCRSINGIYFDLLTGMTRTAEGYQIAQIVAMRIAIRDNVVNFNTASAATQNAFMPVSFSGSTSLGFPFPNIRSHFTTTPETAFLSLMHESNLLIPTGTTTHLTMSTNIGFKCGSTDNACYSFPAGVTPTSDKVTIRGTILEMRPALGYIKRLLASFTNLINSLSRSYTWYPFFTLIPYGWLTSFTALIRAINLFLCIIWCVAVSTVSSDLLQDFTSSVQDTAIIPYNHSYVQLAEKRIATVQQNLWTSGSEAIAV